MMYKRLSRQDPSFSSEGFKLGTPCSAEFLVAGYLCSLDFLRGGKAATAWGCFKECVLAVLGNCMQQVKQPKSPKGRSKAVCCA